MMMDHPEVSPWMLHDGEAVRTAGERLREVARLLGGVEVTVGSTLGSAAASLGWEGQITDRAEETAERTRSLVTRLADGCEAAGTALLELAGAMSWHGPRLVELLQGGAGDPTPRFGLPVEPRFGLPVEPRFGSPGGPGPGPGIGLPVEPGHGLPGQPRIGLPVEPRHPDGGAVADGMRHITPIGDPIPFLPDQDLRIREHVEDLELADRRCHDRLVQVRADLDALAPPGTDPHYLRSVLPPGAWRRLREVGIVPAPDPTPRPTPGPTPVPTPDPGGRMRHTPGFRTHGPGDRFTGPVTLDPADPHMEHTPGFRTHGPGGSGGSLTVEPPAAE